MKKKVLVFSSSPRRNGNSDLLCDQFIKGAREAGHHAEKIFLKDVKINYCNGCGTCIDGKNECPQKDDMAGILDKMIAADILVLATPVYFYTMSAQMKTLIDRCCCRYTEISNKEFYFILTAADTNVQAMERTVEGFRGFTSCLNGPKEKGIIYGVGAWHSGDIKESPTMWQTFDLGKKA
jgi:multimeric flavodoxin WrbA